MQKFTRTANTELCRLYLLKPQRLKSNPIHHDNRAKRMAYSDTRIDTPMRGTFASMTGGRCREGAIE
jgi:hypothetical protein